MTRARDIANLVDSNGDIVAGALDNVPANRNLIIGGCMRVSQRGSSHTTEGYGSLDRYYLALSGASGVTMSQEAFSTADRNSLGFEKYLKLAVTTANNNCGVYHKIEASNAVHLIGNKATLSFYAKGTNPAGGSFTIIPSWYNNSSGGGDNGVAQSLTVTSSWVKYSFTFDIPAPANTTIDNSAYLSISFTQPNGDTSTTAWELNLAGLQFELGQEATPFEHRSFGDELALCQRFYYQTPNSEHSVHTVRSYNNGNQYYGTVAFPVTMRANPTFSTQTNTINLPSISNTTGTFSAYNRTRHRVIIKIIPASNAGSYTYTVIAVNNAMKFDAEL